MYVKDEIFIRLFLYRVMYKEKLIWPNAIWFWLEQASF